MKVVNKWKKYDKASNGGWINYELENGEIVIGYKNLLKRLQELGVSHEESKRKSRRVITTRQSQSEKCNKTSMAPESSQEIV